MYDNDIFKEWLIKKKKELTHIAVKYFDPNTTAWVQLDDQGYLRAFKYGRFCSDFKKMLFVDELTKLGEQNFDLGFYSIYF